MVQEGSHTIYARRPQVLEELEGHLTEARALVSFEMMREGGGKFGCSNMVGSCIHHRGIGVWW